MYLLLIIGTIKIFVKNNNLNIMIFNQIKFFIKTIMIFIHGHIFDPSEYFAIDSDHLLKYCEIFHMK